MYLTRVAEEKLNLTGCQEVPANSAGQFQVLDSGYREQFQTGSRRDTQEGKGDFDLIPLRPLLRVAARSRPACVMTRDDLIYDMREAAWHYGEPDAPMFTLEDAALLAMWIMELERLELNEFDFLKVDRTGLGGLPFDSLRRIAELYRKGAVKYSRDNWRHGFPFTRMRSSLRRHASEYLWETTEDHLAAVVFNAFCLMEFEEMIGEGALPSELNDLRRPGKTTVCTV